MAKMSKKNPAPSPPIEAEAGMSGFIMEGMEEIYHTKGSQPINYVPKVDMYSTPEELIIEAEMAGVRKEDIDVTLFKNTVVIKAIKFECFDEKNVNYVCMERNFGKIYRTVELPFPVDTGRIKAIYKNGILTIIIPRIEDRRVKVKHIPIDSQ